MILLKKEHLALTNYYIRGIVFNGKINPLRHCSAMY